MAVTNQPTNSSWFKEITTAVQITAAKKVSAFSIQVISGTCEINGGAKFDGEDSSSTTIPEGGVYTKQASAGGVLDGYTITPTGTTNLTIDK